MTAIVVPPTAGRTVPAAAGLVTWKLAAEAIGGALALFEQDLAPGAEVAMRSDARENRAIYVLAGEILLVGERRLERLPAGSFAWIPKGARHGFMNASEDEPARLLGFYARGAAADGAIEFLAAAPRRPRGANLADAAPAQADAAD